MAKRKNSVKKELLSKRAKGIDKILIFRFFKLLHGRFWGLGAIIAIQIGAFVGYLIRPDLLDWNVPLSHLGTDVRSAPFFAGSMFFAAYCLWRWRSYLSRTYRNKRPVIPFLSFTILGLYLIALMPVTWEVWPARLHHIGVVITGISMAATVIADTILTKSRKSAYQRLWQSIKLLSFMLIIVGGAITVLSIDEIGILQLIFAGELIMFIGYSTWIVLKTMHGEERRSALGRFFERIIS